MRLECIRLDIRDALRSLRRSPLFTCGVVGTIGLGLGFVCSAFTVINGYLLKPFDLRDPHQLYELSWDTRAERRHRFDVDQLDALAGSADVFSAVFAFGGFQFAQGDATVSGQFVTGNYFEALGVQPFLGRLLQEDDARRPGERAAVVLAHDAWLAHYGADPSIVGTDRRLGRSQFTVVGIAQPGFKGFGDAPISFWVPATMVREFPARDPYAADRPPMLIALARLRDGVAPETASAWFDTWVKRRFADAPADERPIATRFESRATRIPITGTTASMFTAILAAFGLVLLIACANVANMMLARGLGRQREIAVRLSLGASRARIVRQLLVESLLLAAPAAVIGLALAFATARAVPAVIVATWPEGLPPVQAFLAPMDPDIRVVSFLMLAAVAAAVLFGLSPALQTTRTSLSRASRGELGQGVRLSRVRDALVIAQIAVCALFLVIASGLIVELRRLSAIDPGLDIDGVADLRVPAEYRRAVLERLAADGRVAQIAATWRPPLYGELRTVPVIASGSRAAVSAGFMVVSPEYFDLFRVPLLRGRVFTREEAESQADVAMVSEATARRFWPNADAVGQVLEVQPRVGSAGMRGPSQTRVRVIGIVRDVTSGAAIDGRDVTCVYFPTSAAQPDTPALLLRARGDLSSLRAAVAAATEAVREDASFPLYPMRQVLGVQVWAMEAISATVSLLGLIALLLACSGTYGVVAYLVMQRTREFGIRMALGATVSGVVRSVLGEAMRLGARGIVFGGVLALAVSRVMASGIEIMPAFGPAPYLIGALIVVCATAVAAAVPSLRASRANPAEALRAE